MGTFDDDRSQAPSVADDEATAPTENEDTIDPREEEQDIWAQAEGYTPLSDIQYTSLMVSMGPSDGEDEDEDDDNSNAGEIRTAHGSFFVDPSAFSVTGNEENRNSGDEVLSERIADAVARLPDHAVATQEGDFQELATKALSLLDQEYERTLKGGRHSLSWQDNSMQYASDCGQPALGGGNETDATMKNSSQEEEDIKIIAAAFDERRKTVQKNGFVAEWDVFNMPTRKGPPTASEPAFPTSADTDAVRKAVDALSQNSDNPFQQKFVAWQERQQSLPAKHELIPATPYKAFRRSTGKAKQASASLSRSATLAEAFIRLHDQGLMPKTDASTLVIDIVGVDHVECRSIERIQTTFRPIIRWIGAWKGCRYQKVHLRLVGRDLTSGSMPDSSVDLLTPHIPTLLSSAIATCHSGVYHTWLYQLSEDSSVDDHFPHLSIAYNAGIWGYKEWEPTVQYLAERAGSALPFVITAYTLEECQEDMEVVKATVETKGAGKVLWEAQTNPFGSKTIRETKSSSTEYRENAAWQAWLLGQNP